MDGDGNTVNTGVNAKIIGPVADMDKDGTLEVTAVNANGDLILIPAVSNANETTLVTDATKADPAARTIAIGDVDGDGAVSVLYSQKGSLDIYKYEVGGDEGKAQISDVASKGIVGYGEFGGDADDEIVYRGSSGQIKWIDAGESTKDGDTGYSNYGSNNGVGLGPLTDYNDSGVNRVGVISGSNVPGLHSDSGAPIDKPDGSYQQASKAGVAAANVTGNGNLEIMHRNSNTGTIYYMTTDGSSAEYTPGGSAISVSGAQGLSGTGTASRIGATASDYATPPAVNISNPDEGTVYNSSELPVPLDVSSNKSSNWTYSVDGGANQTATGANGTQTLNTTLSGLADGEHTVTVYAEDDAGNVGSETVNFSVDTTTPSISNFTAANPDGQNVAVSFDSSEELATISVSISGAEDATLTESDFTYHATNSTYTATYEGSSDGTYNATLETAKDSAGNDGATDQSDETTVDTSAPTVTIDEPADGATLNANDLPAALNASASETSDWSYSVDGGANQTASGANGTQTLNTTLNGLSDGGHTATVYAEDDSGNVGTETVTFSVDTDTAAPDVSIDEPNESETYATTSVDLNATASESSDWTYSVDGGANQTAPNSATLNTTLSGLSDGSHNVTVYAEDDAGNVGSDSVTFTVDTTSPAVSIDVPAENQILGTDSVDLNASASETSDWTYTLDGGANQTATTGTQTLNTTLSGLSDGSHNITVYAEDDAGNVGTETVTFSVDTTAPAVTINDPTESETSATSSVNLNASASETSDWSYSVDGGANQTASGANGTQTLNTTLNGLSDGEHTATVYAEDDSGNLATDTVTFSVDTDTAAPTVTINDPNEGDTYATGSVDLNATASETSDWTYSVDGGANQTAPNSATLDTTLTGLSDGNHNVTVYAEDDAGNVGSETVTFSVDTTASSISNFTASNPDGQNVSVSFDSSEELDNISVDISGAENVTLTEGDFTEDNGTYTTTYEGSSDGTYNATLETAEDAAGNDGATGQSDEATVDTTAAANFDVLEPIEAPWNVNASSEFGLYVDVKNTGNVEGTQNLTLTIPNASVSMSKEVTIAAGENASIQFSGISIDEPNLYKMEAASDDDNATKNIDVLESTTAANFDVEITEAPDVVDSGDTAVVKATVTNTGETTENQQIHLKNADHDIVDSVKSPPLTLASGESKTVTLTWQTTESSQSGNVSVQSDDDIEERYVGIRDGPACAFDVSQNNRTRW